MDNTILKSISDSLILPGNASQDIKKKKKKKNKNKMELLTKSGGNINLDNLIKKNKEVLLIDNNEAHNLDDKINKKKKKKGKSLTENDEIIIIANKITNNKLKKKESFMENAETMDLDDTIIKKKKKRKSPIKSDATLSLDEDVTSKKKEKKSIRESDNVGPDETIHINENQSVLNSKKKKRRRNKYKSEISLINAAELNDGGITGATDHNKHLESSNLSSLGNENQFTDCVSMEIEDLILPKQNKKLSENEIENLSFSSKNNTSLSDEDFECPSIRNFQEKNKFVSKNNSVRPKSALVNNLKLSKGKKYLIGNYLNKDALMENVLKQVLEIQRELENNSEMKNKLNSDLEMEKQLGYNSENELCSDSDTKHDSNCNLEMEKNLDDDSVQENSLAHSFKEHGSVTVIQMKSWGKHSVYSYRVTKLGAYKLCDGPHLFSCKKFKPLKSYYIQPPFQVRRSEREKSTFWKAWNARLYAEDIPEEDIESEWKKRIKALSDYFEFFPNCIADSSLKGEDANEGENRINLKGPYLPTVDQLELLQKLEITLDDGTDPCFGQENINRNLYCRYSMARSENAGLFSQKERDKIWKNWTSFKQKYKVVDLRPLLSHQTFIILGDWDHFYYSRAHYITAVQQFSFLKYMQQGLEKRNVTQILIYIREWIIGPSGRKYGAENDQQNTTKIISSQWDCTKLRMVDAFVEKHGVNMDILNFFLLDTKVQHLHALMNTYRYKLYPLAMGQWSVEENMLLLEGLVQQKTDLRAIQRPVSCAARDAKKALGLPPIQWSAVANVVRTRLPVFCDKKINNIVKQALLFKKYRRDDHPKSALDWTIHHEKLLIEKLCESPADHSCRVDYYSMTKLKEFEPFCDTFLSTMARDVIIARVPREHRVHFEDTMEYLYSNVLPAITNKVDQMQPRRSRFCKNILAFADQIPEYFTKYIIKMFAEIPLHDTEDDLQNEDYDLQNVDDDLQNVDDEMQNLDDDLQNGDDDLQNGDDDLQNEDHDLQNEDHELQNEDHELQNEDDELQVLNVSRTGEGGNVSRRQVLSQNKKSSTSTAGSSAKISRMENKEEKKNGDSLSLKKSKKKIKLQENVEKHRKLCEESLDLIADKSSMKRKHSKSEPEGDDSAVTSRPKKTKRLSEVHKDSLESFSEVVDKLVESTNQNNKKSKQKKNRDIGRESCNIEDEDPLLESCSKNSKKR